MTVQNGYSKNARSRPTLADSYTLTGGATEADRTAAKSYFASDMAKLSSLTTDSERVSYIYNLLQKEYRTAQRLVDPGLRQKERGQRRFARRSSGLDVL